jgi:hypothetical protein
MLDHVNLSTTASLDARGDDRRFSFREERLASDGRGLRRLIRERYYRKVSRYAQEDHSRAFLSFHQSPVLLGATMPAMSNSLQQQISTATQAWGVGGRRL